MHATHKHHTQKSGNIKQRVLRYVYITLVLFCAVLFVAKFGGQSILKLYIKTGIGDCQKIPIFCMAPEEKRVNPPINKEYVAELLPYSFPKMAIYVPKGFTVVQETIKKVYYKKRKSPQNTPVIYVLHEEPGFFIYLFPQLKKEGINDQYAFIKRIMYAKIADIKNVTDTFFVIMKGIFTADLGDQKNIRMVRFTLADKRGFINYNLTPSDNYFDCNIVTDKDGFFKIYIKDKGAKLDLDKVLAIISTIRDLT